MDLSNEDSLRINVLLNQELEAVRIDDSRMIVYGLSPRGEARVQLNPNCREDQYIKKVKETISSHVLGSPGGYPIFLRRWTRMGQARDQSLESLLKLGEPEAVVAVVHAQGITNELARRAWWCMPNSINARCMLESDTVVQGEMGRVLAEFLLEFLPFEEDPKDMINSVKLVLKPGLINNSEREALWSKGQRRNALLVGFLKTIPDDLPDTAPAHVKLSDYQAELQILAENGNTVARHLLRVMQPAGQVFIRTASAVLRKPANQDVVVALMEAIESYFRDIRMQEPVSNDLQELCNQSRDLCDSSQNSDVCEVLEKLPESKPLVSAMLTLSLIGVHVVNPIFAITDAIGTVMRKKIEPVSGPVMQQFSILSGKSA